MKGEVTKNPTMFSNYSNAMCNKYQHSKIRLVNGRSEPL